MSARARFALHKRKPVRVADDDFRAAVGSRVHVPDGRLPREPPHFALHAVASADVLAQGVHLVLRVTEDDGQHELALRAVLEDVGRELEIEETLGVQKMDDPAAIDRVPSQAVRMPGDDPAGFAIPDSRHHLIEHRSSWEAGAPALGEHLFYLEPARGGEPEQFDRWDSSEMA